MKTFRYVSGLFLGCILFPLAGCNGSGSGDAALNLYVADTPVDGATSVNLVFTGVEIQGAAANSGMGMGMDMGMDMMDMDAPAPMEYDFAMPKQIDLMAQQGGNAAMLLNGVTLPSGSYQWIRLKVDTSQSTITLSDGSVHPLTIPSDAQTGLQLVSGFDVAGDSTASFTIDFDLRKSITLANGNYMMKPALRLIDNQQAGTLSGSVSNNASIGGVSIADPACSPAVYIYSGNDVTPTDLNPSSTMQPVATASMQLDNATGNYVYKETLLAPGNYTLAMTCAADDDPATADALTFSTIKATAVTANQTTIVDAP